MELTVYLTLEEVLELHTEMLRRYGGAEGVRDLGLLESALARPRSGYYESLAEQAAALLHSLANNHPFVDANKRVAWVVTAVFLDVNGFELHVRADVAERFLVKRVIREKLDASEITPWIEKHMVARKKR